MLRDSSCAVIVGESVASLAIGDGEDTEFEFADAETLVDTATGLPQLEDTT